MSLSVLINPRSGSVPAGAPELIRSKMEQLGKAFDLTVLESGDIRAQIEACLATSPESVIVWSGDGTLACTLHLAGADGPPILPLPGGTMNLFHKKIHGAAYDWKTCLERGLRNGQVIDVPAGCAGEHQFYVAAMAGNLTDLARPREDLREGHILEAMERLSGSDVLNLDTTMSFLAEGGPDGEQKGFATAAAIFVGETDAAHFEFTYIDPDNPFELVAAGVSALFTDLSSAAGVTTLHSDAVTLNHQKGQDLRMTLDGEPVRLRSGTRFYRTGRAAKAISAKA